MKPRRAVAALMLLAGHAVPRAAEIRALLARHLADCGAAPRRIAPLLRGLEPAWRLASAWAADAEAATAAEAAAIADHRRD